MDQESREKLNTMHIYHDDVPEKDEIGHEYSTKTLVKLISSVSLKAKGSFTIGIYGEWGSGKTTMLKHIQTMLEDSQREASEGYDTVTIWFNPWQFTAGENIVNSFFQLLSLKLEEISKVQKKCSKGRMKHFATALKKAAASYDKEIKVQVGIPLVASIEYGHKKRIQDDASIYYDMINYLQKAAKKMEVKIVIFIDDLDRCVPDQTVQLLDGLKVLLDIPNFVFVIGVARNVIQRAVNERYKGLFQNNDTDAESSSVDYLDKIIQFPFYLPKPDKTKLKNILLNPYFSTLKEKDKYSDIVLVVLGTNMRSIKRFLNVVTFSKHQTVSRFDGGKPILELIVKISLLAYALPELYEQLENAPKGLSELNKKVAAVDKTNVDWHKSIRSGNTSIDNLITRRVAILIYNILECECEDVGFTSESIATDYVRLTASALNRQEVNRSGSNRSDSSRKSYIKVLDRLVKISPSVLNREEGGSEPTSITILKPFLVDPYPVTQKMYSQIVGKNPSYFQGTNTSYRQSDQLPVETVTWMEAIEFCNKLSEKYDLEPVYSYSDPDPEKCNVNANTDKDGFRLPTEAEWEFMCGDKDIDEEYIKKKTWQMGNSRSQTHIVGSWDANEYGIYDMLGNVWEWCYDWSSDNSLRGKNVNPQGSKVGNKKVSKGGSWGDFPESINPKEKRLQYPDFPEDNIGFRVVSTAKTST